MGLGYFYGNQSTEVNKVANLSLYFGNIYRDPRRRRCMSKDKNIIESDINNKSIHSYFSKDTTKSNIFNFSDSNNKINNNIREEDFQNNKSSITTISSNSSIDEKKDSMNSIDKENTENILYQYKKNKNIRN